MNRLYLVMLMCVGLLASCCCQSNMSTKELASNFIYRQKVVATTKQTYASKNPEYIPLYTTKQKPITPYRVIGVATVSKYNLLGKPRSQETLHEMMKKLAASIGGDALINVTMDDKTISGHIIQFQQLVI